MIRRVSPSTTLARHATRSALRGDAGVPERAQRRLGVRRDREHLRAPAARPASQRQRREAMTTGSRVTRGVPSRRPAERHAPGKLADRNLLQR